MFFINLASQYVVLNTKLTKLYLIGVKIGIGKMAPSPKISSSKFSTIARQRSHWIMPVTENQTE